MIFEIGINNVTNYDLKKKRCYKLKVIILVTKRNKMNVGTFNFIHFQILILKINAKIILLILILFIFLIVNIFILYFILF